MSQDAKNRVCPVELADGLDSKLRKFLQSPRKILHPYIKDGMTILDVGCGPGVFSIEMAKMVGPSGHVIAADLQEGMLSKLRKKVERTDLESIIELHKCETDKIGVSDKADFVLSFYMVHEVPDKIRFFKEIKTVLKSDGRFLIVEPNFHVSRKEFDEMQADLAKLGFEIDGGPKIFFSRSLLLRNSNRG